MQQLLVKCQTVLYSISTQAGNSDITGVRNLFPNLQLDHECLINESQVTYSHRLLGAGRLISLGALFSRLHIQMQQII